MYDSLYELGSSRDLDVAVMITKPLREGTSVSSTSLLLLIARDSIVPRKTERKLGNHLSGSALIHISETGTFVPRSSFPMEDRQRRRSCYITGVPSVGLATPIAS